MDQIVNQREIIDRRSLIVALDAVAADPALSAEVKRAKVRDLVKAGLAAGSSEIRTRFENGTGGIATARAQCFLVDQIVRLVHDHAERHIYPIANPTQAERLAIVAVGGYGRGELAPHSDIDLLFLRPYKQTPRGEQLVEFLLYMLWDLGLKVGHATRSIDDCLRLAREDLTIRTALLEVALPVGRRQALCRVPPAIHRRRGQGHRRRVRRGEAGRAQRAPQAPRRLALRARAQRQGGQGRPARPPHAVLDRASTSTSSTASTSSCSRAC